MFMRVPPLVRYQLPHPIAPASSAACAFARSGERAYSKPTGSFPAARILRIWSAMVAAFASRGSSWPRTMSPSPANGNELPLVWWTPILPPQRVLSATATRFQFCALPY
jgi:hypothetical protein